MNMRHLSCAAHIPGKAFCQPTYHEEWTYSMAGLDTMDGINLSGFDTLLLTGKSSLKVFLGNERPSGFSR